MNYNREIPGYPKDAIFLVRTCSLSGKVTVHIKILLPFR